MELQVFRMYGEWPSVLLSVAGVVIEMTDQEALRLARQLIELTADRAREELDH